MTRRDDIEFPEMNQGVLDQETLEAYFDDLEHTRVFTVKIKGGPRRRADDESLALETGRRLFESGEAHGLQIRYLWDGGEWWDTLFRTGNGTQLVRVRHDFDDED